MECGRNVLFVTFVVMTVDENFFEQIWLSRWNS